MIGGYLYYKNNFKLSSKEESKEDSKEDSKEWEKNLIKNIDRGKYLAIIYGLKYVYSDDDNFKAKEPKIYLHP